jgi:hypothetical protein
VSCALSPEKHAALNNNNINDDDDDDDDDDYHLFYYYYYYYYYYYDNYRCHYLRWLSAAGPGSAPRGPPRSPSGRAPRER